VMHGAPGRLLAVTQGGVEEDDLVLVRARHRILGLDVIIM
jgi:hypothetical protein